MIDKVRAFCNWPKEVRDLCVMIHLSRSTVTHEKVAAKAKSAKRARWTDEEKSRVETALLDAKDCQLSAAQVIALSKELQRTPDAIGRMARNLR